MNDMTDPAEVPVQTAATVLVVDDRPDLHVLCLRRRAGSAIVGGMTVFPGGALDPDDHDDAYLTVLDGIDPTIAAARLGLDDEPDGAASAVAYWVAVVRETLEEVGVLLAKPRSGAGDLAAARAERHAVDRGERRLLEVLEAHDLVVDGALIRDIGRWITPVGPPRRYDTRFFIAALPEGQDAEPDLVEAVHSEWLRPADALDKWRAGELVMLPPTVCMLQVLARFGSADDVLAAADRAIGPGVYPHIVGAIRGVFEVYLPDDPGYDHPDAFVAEGWVYRLEAQSS